MKFAYHTITWGGVVGHPTGVTSIKDLFYLANGSDEEALDDISAAGFEGIEVFDGNLYRYVDKPETFEKLLSKYSLKLVAVYSGANFVYEDILDDELWRIKESIKLGQRFGAEHFVVGGGAVRSGGTLPEDYVQLAKGLDRVSDLAQHYGLIPSYHPHLGTIGQSPEQIDKIFELTSINFCPDTAHLVAGGADILAMTQQYVDRIKYIHFKDYQNGEFCPLGRGELPFEKIVHILSANAYDGWITVELDSFDGHPKDAAVASKLFLSNLIKS